MLSDVLEKRIKGCLVGVAAGDAMGMPSSMMSPETIQNTFGHIDTFLPAPDGHLLHHGMAAGAVTDDTQQTLLIADSIIANGDIDPQDIAQRLIRWGEEIRAFDSMAVGPSSLRALHAIKSGKSIYEAGRAGDTNGAVMRIAPVGLLGCGNRDKTLDLVSRACIPTHNTNIAIAGAAAVAMAIGLALQGEQDVDSLIKSSIEIIEPAMKLGNTWYSASIHDRATLALDIVTRAQDRAEAMSKLYRVIGAGVQISETVPTCLALTRLVDGDPVQGVIAAANLGGDCDTIGAITGGMCGAIKGIDAFPGDWIELLSATNNIDFDWYAGKLYHLITGKEYL
ncbi:MAG TPA: ADP-ribosylglycohydrolase family protein [bacterium]|nr:ADP-ribosylglycohydrolase family protein [bacterium]